MSKLIVDGFEAVHVEEHDTEGALRAARAIQLRFQHAQETPIVSETRQRIADRHGTDLLKKTCLIEQRTGEHHDVADGFADLREEERTVEELPREHSGQVADG